jgi:hypothetical protein
MRRTSSSVSSAPGDLPAWWRASTYSVADVPAGNVYSRCACGTGLIRRAELTGAVERAQREGTTVHITADRTRQPQGEVAPPAAAGDAFDLGRLPGTS